MKDLDTWSACGRPRHRHRCNTGGREDRISRAGPPARVQGRVLSDL